MIQRSSQPSPGSRAAWRWALALLLVLALGARAIALPLPALATTRTVTNGDDSGPGSLRQTIADSVAGDTIDFASGVTTVTLTSGVLTIEHNLTIVGSGQGGVTVTRSALVNTPDFSVFRVNVGTTATLQGLTISNGREPNAGGINVDSSTLTLIDSTVSGNTSFGNAGGIVVDHGSLTLTNSTVSGNSSGGSGGGIYSNASTLTITDSTIQNNTAMTANGGGIGSQISTITVTNSTISDNLASGNGGGIHIDISTLSLTNSALSNNTATNGFGGGLAILNADSEATLTNSTISGNTTPSGGGGGIYNQGQLTITNSTINNNSIAVSSGVGGGLFSDGASATLTVSNSTINNNETTGTFSAGGGLYVLFGIATLTNSTISGNVTTVGGGIANDRGSVTLAFTTIVNNTATSSGGGIDAVTLNGNNAETTFSRSIIAGNTSPNGPDCRSGSVSEAPLTSAGYNVLGGSCPTNGTGDATHSGLLSTLLNTTLADNSGPTKTHALVSGSAAIDRVPNNQCDAATDQRGITRPVGAACDSGAFEGLPPSPSPSPSAPPSPSASPSPSPSASPSASPSPSPGSQVSLLLLLDGNGTIGRNPLGSGNNPYTYTTGTVVTLTAQPASGQTFTGWLVDHAYAGWANPLTITMDNHHNVTAQYAPTKTFVNDVPSGHPNAEAITELATRGNILGYNATNYGPDDPVQRAQMAVLIARATPNGPGTPTNGTLTPPGCTVAGTWDCEDWGNSFTDRGGVPASLWRAAGTLQHYGVAFGYSAGDCANQGRAFPCYGPTDDVSYAQTIAFISRAMIAKGYWVAQPNAPLPGGNVPSVLATPIRTFAFYTGGIPAAPSDWNAGASRGWFAEALWAALDSYWGTDGNLPDGRPGGGRVP